MGFADWFAIKSARQREMERRKYEKWAYPYGDAQKDMLLKIIRELLPEEKDSMVMAIYLLGKEGYQGPYDEDKEFLQERKEEEKVAQAVHKMNPLLTGRQKYRIYRYLALIQADGQIDENLNYPTIQQLRQQAQELEKTIALR